MLTLLVNGTTSRWVIHALRIDSVSEESKKIYESACMHIERYTDAYVDKIKNHILFSHADWNLIWHYLPVHTQQVYEKRRKKCIGEGNLPANVKRQWQKYEKMYETRNIDFPRKSFNSLNSMRRLSMKVLTQHLSIKKKSISEARHRFLRYVIANYRHQLVLGFMGNAAFVILNEASSRQLDAGDDSTVEWDYLESKCTFPAWYERLRGLFIGKGRLSKFCRRLLRSFLHHHLALIFELALNFIEAHQNVSLQMFNPMQRMAVQTELTEKVQSAMKTHQSVESMFPDITRAISTERGCKVLVEHERKHILKLFHAGEIDEKEAHGLIAKNVKAFKMVRMRSHALRIPTIQELFQVLRCCESLLAKT